MAGFDDAEYYFEFYTPKVIKQLDQKYIPPQTVYVNITENEDGSLSADKTYVEIKEHINNGGQVVAVLEYMSFDILAVFDGGVQFVVVFPDGGYFNYASLVILDDDSVIISAMGRSKQLPPVTTSDNGKFLQVVGGTWKASSDVIIPSSTSGSTKKFKITVDDSGTISATEVTT